VTRRVLAAAAVLGAVFSSSLSAQASGNMSRSNGLAVGFSGTGTSVTTQNEGDKRTQYGYGYQVEGSFGFAKRFALGIEYAYSNINNSEHGEEFEPYTLSHVGLIGRYFFRDDTKRARPYAEIGVLQRTINVDSTDNANEANLESTSLGVGLGFGAAFFVTSRLALDISGQAGLGTFTEWKANGNDIQGVGDVKASSLILRLGARFYIW
jgi:opacity protein-like surface antigen